VFKEMVMEYCGEYEVFSDRLARLMAMGLRRLRKERQHAKAENDNDVNDDEIVTDRVVEKMLDRFLDSHTSYLRLNRYPSCPHPPPSLEEEKDIRPNNSDSPQLGTIAMLSQDDGCHSFQILTYPPTNNKKPPTGGEDEWITVQPHPVIPNINMGDVATIWNNGIFRVPLHRLRHPFFTTWDTRRKSVQWAQMKARKRPDTTHACGGISAKCGSWATLPILDRRFRSPIIG